MPPSEQTPSRPDRNRTRDQRLSPGGRIVSFLLTFCLMFGLWVVFSGLFEPLLLGLGVISSLIVAGLSHELIFPAPRLAYPGNCLRFIGYVPWLLWEVFRANIHLLRLVFHPRMMDLIDPHIVTLDTPLRGDLSLVAMANSITLTPGTITISVDHDGRFKVHAIDQASAEGLPGIMGRKLEHVFEG